MSENPIETWYNSDSSLLAILNKVNAQDISPLEQAMMAFDLIAENFNLPKYPDSFTEADFEKYSKERIDNPRSVYEEVGIIRYLEPADDPRGVVLCALYNVKHRTYIDYDICAERHFGGRKNIPGSYQLYFTGERTESKLHFLNDGESWNKPGVKYSQKIVRRNPHSA